MPATALQLALEFPVRREPIDRRFRRFHAENPHVYQLIEDTALLRYRSGVPRIGMKALYEEIRGRVPGRLDNSFTALYARLLIERHPRLAAVIETRARKAES